MKHSIFRRGCRKRHNSVYLSLADHAFPGGSPCSTLQTFPPTNKLAVPSGAGVDHAKLPVSASPALKTAAGLHIGVFGLAIAHVHPPTCGSDPLRSPSPQWRVLVLSSTQL